MSVCRRRSGTREKKLRVLNRANMRKMPDEASAAPGIRMANCVSNSWKLPRIRLGVHVFIVALSRLIVQMLTLSVPGNVASTVSTRGPMSANSGTGGICGL